MTQETLTKIETIAIYDGWYKGAATYQRKMLEPKKGLHILWISELQYLTSLDWLHTVAMKVLGELNELNYSYEEASIRYLITRGCVKKPINGEYVDLFNAVYDGIVFLNDLKSKQNEH